MQIWLEQQSQLLELYDKDANEVKRLIAYINSKLDCLCEQQFNPIPLDIPLISSEIQRLEKLAEEKKIPLQAAMPQLPLKAVVKYPKVMYKADGSISVAGQRWQEAKEREGLPEDFEGDIEYVKSYTEPNADSVSQIKDWLTGLGWIPIHFKHIRDKKTNTTRQVAQIKSEQDDSDICQSIRDLINIEPSVEHLASYSTIKHRITVFKGFLENMNEDGTLTAEAMGWTNTMRLKHRKIVNLPKPSAPYAEHIREALIAPEGYYMVGSDLKNIEDSTKQSYLYPYDPDYVDSMRQEDWDGHLDIAIRAGLLTEEQVAEHKVGTRLYKEERHLAKTVNFSSTYKVGAKTLARHMKKPEKFAKKVLDAYWERNWAIKAFEKDCKVKTIGEQMWVQQPVSKFWYTLRSEKDIFSTVNQGTAVFVFDVWVQYLRKGGMPIRKQMHDEWLSILPTSNEQSEVTAFIKGCMDKVNNKLKLNVPIGCSIDYGKNYLEVH